MFGSRDSVSEKGILGGEVNVVWVGSNRCSVDGQRVQCCVIDFKEKDRKRNERK
jgi:hypothetical protein